MLQTWDVAAKDTNKVDTDSWDLINLAAGLEKCAPLVAAADLDAAANFKGYGAPTDASTRQCLIEGRNVNEDIEKKPRNEIEVTLDFSAQTKFTFNGDAFTAAETLEAGLWTFTATAY